MTMNFVLHFDLASGTTELASAEMSHCISGSAAVTTPVTVELKPSELRQTGITHRRPLAHSPGSCSAELNPKLLTVGIWTQCQQRALSPGDTLIQEPWR